MMPHTEPECDSTQRHIHLGGECTNVQGRVLAIVDGLDVSPFVDQKIPVGRCATTRTS